MNHAFDVAFIIASEFRDTGGFERSKHKHIQPSQFLGFGNEITACFFIVAPSNPPRDKSGNSHSGERIDQVIVHDEPYRRVKRPLAESLSVSTKTFPSGPGHGCDVRVLLFDLGQQLSGAGVARLAA